MRGPTASSNHVAHSSGGRTAQRSLASSDPLPALASRELARLHELLQQLPEADRRILLTFGERRDEGAWVGELAEELGMTANAVRVRKSRLLDWLRQKMTDDAQP